MDKSIAIPIIIVIFIIGLLTGTQLPSLITQYRISNTLINETLNTTTRKTTPASTKSSTTNTQPLVIEDAVFFRKTNPTGTRMTIDLAITLKNNIDREIRVLWIHIPDANWTLTLNVVLKPGEVYSQYVTVLKDVPSTVEWEAGKVHIIKVFYRVEGTPVILAASIEAIVTT